MTTIDPKSKIVTLINTFTVKPEKSGCFNREP